MLPSTDTIGSKKEPTVLIGADPELFAYHRETGQAISVHDKLPGTKWDPMVVPRGAIQVDGLAAEFNIEPVDNYPDFVKNIKHVSGIMERILSKKFPNLILRPTPVAEFFEEYLKAIPEESKQLGCEPDFNAYTGKENPRPDASVLFRTGSGHIHIGWTQDQNVNDKDHFQMCCDLTKELDFVLYNSSRWWDKDTKRRTLYGQPGAFRPKKYGVEYRVLSNAWLADVRATRFVFYATDAVTRKFLKGFRPSQAFNFSELKMEAFYQYLEDSKLPSPRNFLS